MYSASRRLPSFIIHPSNPRMGGPDQRLETRLYYKTSPVYKTMSKSIILCTNKRFGREIEDQVQNYRCMYKKVSSPGPLFQFIR